MHSVRRHELGAFAGQCIIFDTGCIPCGDMSWEQMMQVYNIVAAQMHSVRRHELGDMDGLFKGFPVRCIPCGDMSWEGVHIRDFLLYSRCIPCGDMSWELTVA